MILFLFIIFLSLIYLFNNYYENFVSQEKPYAWVYWEGQMTPLIELCIEIMKKKLSTNFNLIILNESNINNYIDIKPQYKQILTKFKISHKVDYYRILLLEKYGGIYLDADIVIIKNLKDIVDKLIDHDYVGFGCTGIPCFDGYGTPSNWAMVSRKNGIFVSKVRELQEKILDNIVNGDLIYSKNGYELDYHFIGKIPMWQALSNLIKNNNYKYYHYDNDCSGIRDIDGNWIDNERIISNDPISYKNPENMYFLVFYNSETGNGVQEYLQNKTKDDLINDDTNLAKFLKIGLS